MLQIDIKPLVGIEIKNIGEIKLGQTKKDVENLLGLPNLSDNISIGNIQTNRAFYNEYEVGIDYDDSNTIEFIEFINGPSLEKIQLRVYGIDPFKIEANELIEILSDYNSGKIDETEAPHSYAFENISVGIWRQSVPSDLEEWISEKKLDNTYEIDKSWIDEELERSKHFWTIGIGRKGYYDF